MKAALVTAYGEAPRYADVPEPVASGSHEVVVEVLAAGLHARVRSQAAGSHYTSTDELPLVPGIDGVGRSPDGRLLYFVLPDTTLGAMAERTVVDLRRSVELPSDADPVRIAAAMNPAMSSWVALRRRIDVAPGARVLVLGATGSAGRMAVQIAKRLGASYVAAAGRNQQRLDQAAELGADATVRLDGDPSAVAAALGEAGSDVDVVLDYLWGAPTASAVRAIVPMRVDDGRQLTWIQLGSVAGLESPIPSAALRATKLQIVGSGQGSVSPREIVEELPALVAEIGAGGLDVDAQVRPLSEVAAAWAEIPHEGERLVLVP